MIRRMLVSDDNVLSKKEDKRLDALFAIAVVLAFGLGAWLF